VELNTPDIHKSVINKLKEWKNSPLQFVKECIKAEPTEQQIELLQAIGKEKRITVRSGHGCHARNAIIHMYPYGFKAVQDIKVGDLIMGDDNTPRTVLKLYSGTEEMARIKYHNNTYYDVNMSHILSLVCSGNLGKTARYKAGDKINVSVRDYLSWPEYKRKKFVGYRVGIEYPEYNVKIPPYILGLWLGDGTHNQAELTNIDKEVIGIWQAFGEANNLKMSTYQDIRHRLVFSTVQESNNLQNPFIAALKYYNLYSNKHIPKEYLFNSKKARLQLLAGLIDSDGSKDAHSRQFSITQKSDEVAEDILFLCQSVGLKATLQKTIGTWTYKNIQKKSYKNVIYISGDTHLIPTQIERKKVLENLKTNLHFGFSVERLAEDTYYGFELDGNSLYVLGDFTVTHNTGKDAVASWIALWFLVTRPYAKVVVTAPTNRQLRDIFLAEISKWLRQSLVADEFRILKDSVIQKDASKEWWLRLISPSVRATKDEQAETLAGLHGDHLLIICDESSGIPDPTFIPLEGAMSQPDNKVLLIGNMTRNSGYYYDTHFSESAKQDWYRLHWDSRKSSNVDKSMPEYFARKYGIDSNIFRIRVEGNPPLQDENTLIPLWAAIQCIGNTFDVAEDEPLYLGVDVARYGSDASIILPRQGLRIDPWETFRKLNTIDLGGFINQTYQELNASGVAIDVIGVGAGVADWLEKHNLRNLYQVNVTNSSSNIEKFHKLRDELWVRVRDNCILGKYSFPEVKLVGDTESLGNQLANELATVRYKFNQHGGIIVESKKDMKARGIASPNIADALGLTEYFANSATKVFAKLKQEEVKRNYSNGYGESAWML
jgi:hypothetical protein